MKYPLPIVLLTASVFFVAGCSSLENPFGGLFGTGRDARVYNVQTGEYEWPEDSSKPRARKPGAAPVADAASAPVRKTDGRYFDSEKGQWVQATVEEPAGSRAKSRPASPVVTPPPPQTPATPPPVAPSRASGVYNPSTGQIEWRAYDPVSAPAPAPAPRKNWWWPF